MYLWLKQAEVFNSVHRLQAIQILEYKQISFVYDKWNDNKN